MPRSTARRPIVVGLIADTHGLLRPEALAALAGCDRILHAGDIGKPEILDGLGAIAPVDAVRGNNDHGPWADALPDTRSLTVGGATIFLLHDRHELARRPESSGHRVVVAGHSHQPLVEERAGVLHVNPGSAGPRRFKLPISVARMRILDGEVDVELVTLG